MISDETPVADLLTTAKQSDRKRGAEEENEIWMNSMTRLLWSIKARSARRDQFCQKLRTGFGPFHMCN